MTNTTYICNQTCFNSNFRPMQVATVICVVPVLNNIEDTRLIHNDACLIKCISYKTVIYFNKNDTSGGSNLFTDFALPVSKSGLNKSLSRMIEVNYS